MAYTALSIASRGKNLQLRKLHSTVKSTAKEVIITVVMHQGSELADAFNANKVQCLALQIHTSNS